MKRYPIFLAALVMSVVLAAGTAALAADDSNDKPHFNDPGGQNPARYVAQPGGSPYYQRPPFIPGAASQTLSAYSNPREREKRSQ